MEKAAEVKKLLFFKCGFCENNLKRVLRGFTGQKTQFPAGVCCVVFADNSVLLFDTGYSRLVFENGMVSKLYNLLNPATVTRADVICEKLAAQQIKISQVKHILLSHGHPDHMGGLVFLKKARVVLSPEVFESLKKGSLRGLVFRNMRSRFTQKHTLLLERVQHPLLSPYFPEVYDVLGNGAVYAVGLPGHAKGQIGAYIPSHKLFLGADSAWGRDLLCEAKRMKFLPRLIQHSYREYLHTSQTLLSFTADHPEIELVFSHSQLKEGVYEK